jgi:ribosomal protein S18 acetylase RimI-like enzyme
MHAPHAIAAPDLALVLACEQRIVNAWPAPTTLLIGDFVVRMANGYSGRANSASPLRAGADLGEDEIALIEGLFRDAGLPPSFRATPLMAPALRARLDARGYTLKDASFGMIARLDPVAALPDALRIAPAPPDDWIASISRFQVPAKRNPEHLRAIVGAIRLPAAFATLLDGDQAAAFGMSVAERGMAEIGAIMVDETRRGRGLGRALVGGLMSWAKAAGAADAFLQVEQGNARAIGLYRSLGFRTVYAYETLIRSA